MPTENLDLTASLSFKACSDYSDFALTSDKQCVAITGTGGRTYFDHSRLV